MRSLACDWMIRVEGGNSMGSCFTTGDLTGPHHPPRESPQEATHQHTGGPQLNRLPFHAQMVPVQVVTPNRCVLQYLLTRGPMAMDKLASSPYLVRRLDSR